MDKSQLLILVSKDRIEFKPPAPELVAGRQPFEVSVIWNFESGAWTKLTVKNFRDAGGTSLNVLPSEDTWTKGKTVTKAFYFDEADSDFVCKFDVTLENSSGDTFTIDPVILIKKPGP